MVLQSSTLIEVAGSHFAVTLFQSNYGWFPRQVAGLHLVVACFARGFPSRCSHLQDLVWPNSRLPFNLSEVCFFSPLRLSPVLFRVVLFSSLRLSPVLFGLVFGPLRLILNGVHHFSHWIFLQHSAREPVVKNPLDPFSRPLNQALLQLCQWDISYFCP